MWKVYLTFIRIAQLANESLYSQNTTKFLPTCNYISKLSLNL